MSARAAAAGFDFLDGRSAFAGHEICASGDDWWLNSITFPIEESYHPNAAGQSGYLSALTGITWLSSGGDPAKRASASCRRPLACLNSAW